MNYFTLLDRIGEYPIVTDDTRDLVAGGVFVYGAGRDKRDIYLEKALEIGAALVVSEVELSQVPPEKMVFVESRRVASAEMSCKFYNNPSLHLKLIGVTGTCGKTTTTYLLEQILSASGYDVGVIGTENIRYGGEVTPSSNTTPSTFVLNKVLRQMLNVGCTAVAMEVSSHAIDHERIRGLFFDGVIFTNLSVEHLDLHGSMESYFYSKSRLFTDYVADARTGGKTCKIAINVDDEYGRRLFELVRGAKDGDAQSVFGYSLFNTQFDIYLSDLDLSPFGSVGVITYQSNNEVKKIEFESALVGKFNVENIMGAATICLGLGLEMELVKQGVSKTDQVPGRMESILANASTPVIVDYAHKPGALKVVLETIKEVTKGKVICVLGCGGHRDRAKRPLMTEVACFYSDLVIIAPDNLRGEDYQDIVADMLSGVGEQVSSEIRIFNSRIVAIRQAIAHASSEDSILIAGRGAEPYLSVIDESGHEKLIDFDDREVVRSVLCESNSNRD
ncbi:UDP-N-acetylmuramoyl-L-alanyl-D-glutamate--2,6-diaminopimelate ligase [Pseudomonas syringae]|uniref:UDP-N-acetylmuramoyl-L-alanyl-D-glutamate--2, 6-diaminopimelate ligase n=1 Tax=Pseudomonas syringae TaxID=317 RepID=UPI003F84ED0C